MTLEDLIELVAEHVVGRFYGKYEGVVTAVDDPYKIGRLRARVPAVLGEDVETGWAMPCAPFGGGKNRGLLALPEVEDTVWIEFAGGDVSRPIWTGTFWGAPDSAEGEDDLAAQAGAETPTSDGKAAGPGHVVLRTKAGHRVALDDEGGLVIIANGGEVSEIRLKKNGEVVIKAGRIKLCENAAQKLVLGNAFMQLFNAHTHPTGVGPSGPPATPMTPSHLSQKVSTE